MVLADTTVLWIDFVGAMNPQGYDLHWEGNDYLIPIFPPQ